MSVDLRQRAHELLPRLGDRTATGRLEVLVHAADSAGDVEIDLPDDQRGSL